MVYSVIRFAFLARWNSYTCHYVSSWSSISNYVTQTPHMCSKVFFPGFLVTTNHPRLIMRSTASLLHILLRIPFYKYFTLRPKYSFKNASSLEKLLQFYTRPWPSMRKGSLEAPQGKFHLRQDPSKLKDLIWTTKSSVKQRRNCRPRHDDGRWT